MIAWVFRMWSCYFPSWNAVCVSFYSHWSASFKTQRQGYNNSHPGWGFIQLSNSSASQQEVNLCNLLHFKIKRCMHISTIPTLFLKTKCYSSAEQCPITLISQGYICQQCSAISADRGLLQCRTEKTEQLCLFYPQKVSETFKKFQRLFTDVWVKGKK